MIVLRLAQGLDRPEGGRRPADRGHVALAPGPARRRPREARATWRSSSVAAQLPTGGAVRRRRPPPRGARRAAAARRPADERQPARQRRPAAPRPGAARLPRLRASTCRQPGTTTSEATRVLGTFLRDVIQRNPHDVPARSDPTRRPRTGSAPVFEATDRAWMARDAPDRRPPRRPTAASWRSSPSTSARAGWRATC